MAMSETWARLVDKLGFPIFLVIVGLMFYAGAIASPITSTNDLMKAHVEATHDLSNELRKLVRLQSLMCVRQAKPEDCTLALTEMATTTTKSSVLVVK
jgi:hypothetical protein